MIDNVLKGEKITAVHQNKVIDAVNVLSRNNNSVNYNLNSNCFQDNNANHLFQIQIAPGVLEIYEGYNKYFNELVWMNLGADSNALNNAIRVNNEPVSCSIWIDRYSSSFDKKIDDKFCNKLSNLYSDGWIPVDEFRQMYIDDGYETLSSIDLDIIQVTEIEGTNPEPVNYAIIHTDLALEPQIRAMEVLYPGMTREEINSSFYITDVLNVKIAESTPYQKLDVISANISAHNLIQKQLGNVNVEVVTSERKDSQMEKFFKDILSTEVYDTNEIGKSIGRHTVEGYTFEEMYNFHDKRYNFKTKLSVNTHTADWAILSDNGDNIPISDLQVVCRYYELSDEQHLHPKIVYQDISKISTDIPYPMIRSIDWVDEGELVYGEKAGLSGTTTDIDETTGEYKTWKIDFPQLVKYITGVEGKYGTTGLQVELLNGVPYTIDINHPPVTPSDISSAWPVLLDAYIDLYWDENADLWYRTIGSHQYYKVRGDSGLSTIIYKINQLWNNGRLRIVARDGVTFKPENPHREDDLVDWRPYEDHIWQIYVDANTLPIDVRRGLSTDITTEQPARLQIYNNMFVNEAFDSKFIKVEELELPTAHKVDYYIGVKDNPELENLNITWNLSSNYLTASMLTANNINSERIEASMQIKSEDIETNTLKVNQQVKDSLDVEMGVKAGGTVECMGLATNSFSYMGNSYVEQIVQLPIMYQDPMTLEWKITGVEQRTILVKQEFY